MNSQSQISRVQKVIFDRELNSLNYFPKGVVVFDRDGTLIKDAGQHNDIEKLLFLPHAFELLSYISGLGLGIAIASNQAGLSSGKFTLNSLITFNERFKSQIWEFCGAEIDLIAICPHISNSNCYCRKPKPGLLNEIEGSGLGKVLLFIGDNETDSQAAKAMKVDFILADKSSVIEEVKLWGSKYADL